MDEVLLTIVESQFVVLRHHFPDANQTADHWDLMIEDLACDDHQRSLVTWRLDQWPIDASRQVIRLPNHRTRYLNYEGAVSGNRGVVQRVCQGTCVLLDRDSHRWHVRLIPESATPVGSSRQSASESLSIELHITGSGDKWKLTRV